MKRALVILCLSVSLTASCFAQYLGSDLAKGSASSSNATLDQLLKQTAPELTLHADDQVGVQVVGLKEVSFQQRVERDGTLSYPYVGSLKVLGMTAHQVEAELTARLRDKGILKDPQVTAVILGQPSQVVTVSGEVERPGVYPAYGALTLSDYLAEAGGFRTVQQANGVSLASPNVVLVRPGVGVIEIPLGPDAASSSYSRIPLFAGDELRVSRTGVFYVLGAVKSQGSFPLKLNQPTTVSQALALAGGYGFEAHLSGARILRMDADGKKSLISIDLRKVIKGEINDERLQANDVLLVPTNKMLAAIKGGGVNSVSSIVSSLLYYLKR